MSSERELELSERLVKRQVVHEGTYMTFARDTVLDPEGKQHTRDIVLHPGAVTVVAILPDRRLVLVRQYRHAAGEALLELPAGTLDRQPDESIEEPLSAAKRELTEETGYRAGRWRDGMPRNAQNLAGKTLGSVGAGNIAGEMFRMARGLGLGRLLACDPFIA